MIPDLPFWSRLALIVAVQTSCIIAVALVASRWLQSPKANRLIWRTVFVCAFLVTCSSITGAGHIAARHLGEWWPHQSQAHPSVVLEKRHETDADTGKIVRRSFSLPVADPAKVNYWPGLIWLLGCAAITARILMAHGFLAYLRMSRKQAQQGALIHELQTVAAQFSLRRPVKLVEAKCLLSPFTFGIVRPMIVVPAGFDERFSSDQRQVILAHEMAHIVAWDAVWYLMSDCVAALLWWNPLVWLARRRLHHATEIAADDSAAFAGNSAETLAHCLVAMARDLTNSSSWAGVRIHGTEHVSTLRRRVERLLTLRVAKTETRSIGRKLMTCLAALASVALVLLVCGWAQERSPVTDPRFGEPRAPWSVIAGSITGDTPRPPDLIAEMLQDAKAMYEIGKLNEAEAELKLVLLSNSTNKAAQYYMGLIREAQGREHHDEFKWNEPWLLPTLPPKQFVPGQKPVQLPMPDRPFTQNKSSKVLSEEELNFNLSVLRSGGKYVFAKAGNNEKQNLQPKDRRSQLSIRAKVFEMSNEQLKKLAIQNVTVQALEPGNDLHHLVRLLSEAKDVNVRAPVGVTTLSGMGATMEITDTKHPEQNLRIGTVGTVAVDTYSIHLAVQLWCDGNSNKTSPDIQGEATVADRGAMVLISKPKQQPGKRVVAIVMPTTIDAAGNALHQDEDVIKARRQK